MRDSFAACLAAFALVLGVGGCETQDEGIEENGVIEDGADVGVDGVDAELEDEGVGADGAVEEPAVEEESVEDVPEALEEE